MPDHPRPTVDTGSSPARRIGGDSGYFRTNFPCRLPPAPPLMKMGPRSESGKTRWGLSASTAPAPAPWVPGFPGTTELVASLFSEEWRRASCRAPSPRAPTRDAPTSGSLRACVEDAARGSAYQCILDTVLEMPDLVQELNGDFCALFRFFQLEQV